MTHKQRDYYRKNRTKILYNNKIYYRKNKESIKARARKAHFKNRAQNLIRMKRRYNDNRVTFARRARKTRASLHGRDVYLRYNYGISLEDYKNLLKQQEGACDICHRKLTIKNRNIPLLRATVDHNHKTGVVRGILCETCNMALGLFQDSVRVLQYAIDYLGRHTR